mmetsp:Transcript_31019/g.80925  ORF Transcript_31019/g.80925 Transcript_31019/m.80925 type:complete len:266 (+) Transcript_31019:735-1532(+)
MRPKSRMTRRPSGVRSMLPGCGSAWKKPVSSSCVRYVITPRLTNSPTSSAVDCDSFSPSTHSAVCTRRLRGRRPTRSRATSGGMSERATRRLRGCAHNPEGCLCFEAARRLRREVRVVLGDLDAWQDLHILGEPYAVGALEHVVELTVEVGRKLVEQGDDVDSLGALRVDPPQRQACHPREVQVERHRLEHKRPLHLDGHLVTRRTQRRLVNLPERRGRDGLRRDGGENVCDGRAELVRHRGHREARVERRHLVAELLKLHHGLR